MNDFCNLITAFTGVKWVDLRANELVCDLNGAGWINLTDEERKEIKDESAKHI